ncbi:MULTISPECIES: flagellar motor switch protein FliM [unclassified Sphingobium]|uniref:flagellar motor switch protein FliM n=1 Tax=unclassified Sphingobium TaxID=2611147 RepID=UPI001E542F78|nr:MULTISPECIES: FliM/FliN family flagellar motor switch protein [unclassified Sphingobium]GLI97756.1 flagellar motor switch protein FliM [Sphingobium sp. BS19]CAH0349867.1 Flagellar motor switch protein FliM [Sphingobium sp. CECT 9361]
MDDVKSFAFGKGDTQAPVMLSGLDRLGEKLGRRLRAVMEPLVGSRPEIEPQPVSVIDFGEWSQGVASSASISVYRVLPLKGNMLLRLDAGMISTLVDCFYGGVGNRTMPSRPEFTPTEDRLIARLSQSIVEQLAACWADVLPLDVTMTAREIGVGFASATPASDQMVVQRFTISLIRNEQWPIDIVFPLAALRAVEALTGSKVHDEQITVDVAWQTQMQRQMAHIRLPTRTVLARPSLTLTELIQLQPGDVIPVHINRSLPLIVGDRIVAQGSIGEQDGRAAFMIEKLN